MNGLCHESELTIDKMEMMQKKKMMIERLMMSLLFKDTFWPYKALMMTKAAFGTFEQMAK